MNLFYNIKPGVPKRYLLLVAGIIWNFAGGMLFYKGSNYIVHHSRFLFLRFSLGIILGILFFILLFAKISLKHIKRIQSIHVVRPCIFSFFNFRSYILMGLMIATGILLRKTDLINHDILYNFYIIMGIPLLLSSFRFYYSWYKYRTVLNNNLSS